MLRRHQAQLDTIVRGMIERPADNQALTDIVAHVTPGGGKSMLPIIMGRLISAGLADAICWVVPRLTLQYQAEGNFVDPVFRRMLRHNLSIRATTNETDPCRGLNGFVTTYQALATDNRHALAAFAQCRYILVLDEFHHVGVGSEWCGSIEALYRAAKYRLLMTGTLERGDGGQIDFLPYRPVSDGMALPDLCDTPAMRVIRYSRADALREGAIIPIRAILHRGSAKWQAKDGRIYYFEDFSKAPPKHTGAAIYTAINTQFAEALLETGLNHWSEYRQKHRSAKCIVVAANIELANQALDYIRRKRNLAADVATSADTPEAKEAIRRFKAGSVKVLVGVAMFYEGFDCKEISHLICLTNYRSTPWIEQMIARAVRVDPNIPYAGQYAYIFAPDDRHMREILQSMEREQAHMARCAGGDTGAEQLDLFEKRPAEGEPQRPVEPLGSTLDGYREKTLGDAWASSPDTVAAPATPSEIEKALRNDIEMHVRIFSAHAGRTPYHLNRRLKEAFGKSRDAMTAPELQRVKDHLIINYRIDRTRRPPRRVSARQMGG